MVPSRRGTARETDHHWLALFLLTAGPAFAPTSHTIVQKGRAFHPGEITINRGESLTFTNDDDFIHQIYVQGRFSFDTDEKNPGENTYRNLYGRRNLRGPLPHPSQDEACGARKIA